MTDPTREFFRRLNHEERLLAAEVATDKLGMVLRIAINELDLDFENIAAPGLPEYPDRERSYLMRIGALRVIGLALQSHDRFDAPTLTFRRDLTYSLPVLGLIARAATIEHGRRVAQSIIAKGGRIEHLSSRFRIILPERLVDLELHERELDRFYRGQERTLFADRYDTVVGSKVGKEIKRLLGELVYPFREHFIGYEAHPTLDDYYFGLAYSEALLAKGYDTFHFSTIFGGATFAHYRLAATFIVSIGMKHRAYVTALMAKRPSIRIEDVLTVSVETAGFLEGLQNFINDFGARFTGHVEIDESTTMAVFETLSVSRRSLGMLERPGAPIPPLIQCSDDHVIRPLAGSHADEVMVFLLNSLQQRYPREYDRAQAAREGVMQRAVESVLSGVIPRLEFRGNIKLRRAGKVMTDLDLVIFEPHADRVVLVQLKHQDPYGADLATMLARTARLNEQVSGWLGKVKDWLGDADTAEVRATLRLPPSNERPRASLLVLTRHYAHSLRTVVRDVDTIFANWNQLVAATALVREARIETPVIDDLLQALRKLSTPEVEDFLPEPPTMWAVGGLRFTIEQEGHGREVLES
ncbi:hypothetical protein ACFQRC_04350 [Enterovirga sp. GCM10030262]|uniref:hypothetical protein n=1 Tax=Enterovirga sp. GCM10030262 TaxID=3273391 RepID=UPI003617B8D1